jgi:hypothetical protein
MNIDQAIRKLRELNEPVPKPMRLPSEGEITHAEKQLGLTFHPDYRKYLFQASDVVYGTKEPCTITPGGGHTDLIDVTQAARVEMGLPRNIVPICEDNGDYFCMNEAGEVVFWSHNGVTDEKWPDLATWIEIVWIEES